MPKAWRVWPGWDNDSDGGWREIRDLRLEMIRDTPTAYVDSRGSAEPG